MLTRCLQARWLFPVASEPIPCGALEFDSRGRIVALHRRPPQGAEDLGDVALLPGFVNAHAHLEFSDLAAPFSSARPFPAWLRALIAYRRQRGDGAAAIARGLAESRRSGTAALGEIATQDPAAAGRDDPPAAERPEDAPATLAFRELIGFPPEAADAQLEIAERFLQCEVRGELPHRGLSPHAPYSVHPRLLERLIALAARRKAPVTMHLAETEQELRLLREGGGELVNFLTDLGAWRDGVIPRSTRPLDYLRPLSSLERVLIVHGNYLDDEELDFLAAHTNMALVYCPRTHAYFGHANHPWQKLNSRGGLVAIGTDGRGSNPDLSVWNELCFLHARFPACDPALLLRMGTLNGARALGWETRFGTLEPGKAASVAVIRLGETDADDPYAALFSPASRVERLLTVGDAQFAK